MREPSRAGGVLGHGGDEGEVSQRGAAGLEGHGGVFSSEVGGKDKEHNRLEGIAGKQPE